MPALTEGGVIIVNGFFPGLTPKQILVAAAAAAMSARADTSGLQSLSNEKLLARWGDCTTFEFR